MNFTDFDFVVLKSAIDVKCDLIYQEYIEFINNYPEHIFSYYRFYQGKLDGIITCLSALDISENYYDKLYKLVKNYEKRIYNIYIGGVEK